MDSRRRALLCLAGAATVVPQALAQAPKRLALFTRGDQPNEALRGFREHSGAHLATRGWIEGKTLQLESHVYADTPSSVDGLRASARRLVATRPDAIWTFSWFLARALKEVTTTIPIVAVVGEPISTGLAKSLKEPGGNVTGMSLAYDLVARKQVELMKELLPRLTTIYRVESKGLALFGVEDYWGAARRDAGVIDRFASSVTEMDALISRDRPMAGTAYLEMPGWVPGEPPRSRRADRYRGIAELALRHRIASIGVHREHVDAGGLSFFSLEYGADFGPRLAGVIDKILREANPAKTPFELPTRSVFGVNRKTAAAIGIELPTEWILRADYVV